MGHKIIYIPAPIGIKYGLLYNWYTTQGTGDASLTSSNDWVVPTTTQRGTLYTYIGGTSTVGGKLKETGTTYWFPTNVGATNEYGFNGRGTGDRISSSNGIGTRTTFMCSNQFDVLRMQGWQLISTSNNWTNKADNKYVGWSIRLLYVGAGTPTEYVGNDGKVYRVVQIGSQIWLADNLSETRFRNGDIIPWYGASQANYFTNAEWAALTTAGCCAYDNDESNVAAGFSFPT